MHDNVSRPCVQHGVTPFFHAVKQAKDLALVCRLLAAKADPDAADNDGQTALMWSAKEGHKSLIDFCLRAGAKPDAVDSSGKTAMAFAYDGGHADIMSHLIADGANPRDGRSAYAACSIGRDCVARVRIGVREDS